MKVQLGGMFYRGPRRRRVHTSVSHFLIQEIPSEPTRSAPLAVVTFTRAAAAEFHRWKYRHTDSPRVQMSQLLRITRRWLQPDRMTVAGIIERIAMDRFLRSLPGELQKSVGWKDPASSKEMVEATEAAESVLAINRHERREAPAPAPRREFTVQSLSM
uniref:SCAN box domain-containing protein n=1 Tax=Astyanax mexicanus TaxID=7994 RepID=A0A3B1IRR8_ASTMX